MNDDQMLYTKQRRTSEHTTRCMRSNRSKNTSPEVAVRHLLWQSGLKGYRIHYRKLPGCPDIVYTKLHIAIFVHGCFWHGCDRCRASKKPKTNVEFWDSKIAGNIERFKRNLKGLDDLGYTTIVVWECDLKKEPFVVLKRICSVLEERKQRNMRVELHTACKPPSNNNE